MVGSLFIEDIPTMDGTIGRALSLKRIISLSWAATIRRVASVSGISTTQRLSSPCMLPNTEPALQIEVILPIKVTHHMGLLSLLEAPPF
jgi:hypothetical protein